MPATKTATASPAPTASDCPGARQLVELLRQAQRTRRLVAEFQAAHGPRCRCPLCGWARGHYLGDLRDDLTALRIVAEQVGQTIENGLPYPLCEEMYDDQD